MKKIISIFILTIGLVTQQAQAIDEAEIDKLEKSVDKLYLTVDKLTNIIVSNEQRGTLEILNDYKSPKAKIIQQWIFIVAQKKKHRSMATFINDSHYKMNSYLGQMQFDSEEAIKSEDYAAIKKEISRIIKNRPSPSKSVLNHNYFARVDVHVRSLPIVIDLTKQEDGKDFLILKKKDFFKLLYKIEYQTPENETSRWGYIEIDKNKRRGWVNLKYAYKVLLN